ncbi:class I SAM-dependent methyltransferase [Sphingomonas alpina]|uniref:Class I SAM-dependent methyltransferase n=1 Tax=Sphingomonas alpina TaxID=653931 RepID=A0A7H0LF96_9SPHN|nr:class I SAM-dependent methyltransferase [Sphingomonas alpina]QNQ08349.1 class I SAM-dependent methyltransferase [Sphingomonas alpina]
MKHDDHLPDDAVAPDNPFVKHFSDPEAVSNYAEGPRRVVPGLEALHRMTAILLAERVPADARVLVLGAGGGMELQVLAQAHPGWTFVGVDPAAAMLRLAERTIGPDMARVDLIEGYIDDAPPGPFDAAVCLLTLHFLDAAERERTVGEIHRRLRPGAPFVAAHLSFPQGAERELWLDRHVAYPVAMGADPEQMRGAREAVATRLATFSPGQDEAILRAGGFPEVSLFFAAFAWRGWIANA